MNMFIDFKEINSVIKDMPTKKKLEYIWHYYWIWICSVIFVIAMTLYLGYHIFFTVGDNWLFLLITNTRESVGNESDLWEEYVHYSGYDIQKKNVDFNNNSFFDASSAGGSNNNYYQAFIAFLDSKTLDAVIGNRESMLAVGESGRFMDLDQDVCSAIKAKYGDRFIYCTPADDDYGKHEVPVAIDLCDSRLMTEYHVYAENESCVLCINAYAPHMDAIELFLDMVLEE